MKKSLKIVSDLSADTSMGASNSKRDTTIHGVYLGEICLSCCVLLASSFSEKYAVTAVAKYCCLYLLSLKLSNIKHLLPLLLYEP